MSGTCGIVDETACEEPPQQHVTDGATDPDVLECSSHRDQPRQTAGYGENSGDIEPGRYRRQCPAGEETPARTTSSESQSALVCSWLFAVNSRFKNPNAFLNAAGFMAAVI